MNAGQRSELKARREALKLRIADARARAAIAPVLEALRVARIEFELIPSCEPADHEWFGPLRRAPPGGGGIDWQRMSSVTYWADQKAGPRGSPSAVEHAVAAFCGPETSLTLTSDNGALPSLRLGRESVAVAAEAMTRVTSRCWIFDPAGDWIVESDRSGMAVSGRTSGPGPGLAGHSRTG